MPLKPCNPPPVDNRSGVTQIRLCCALFSILPVHLRLSSLFAALRRPQLLSVPSF